MKLFRCLKFFVLVFAIFAMGCWFLLPTSYADISSVGFVHAKILEIKGIDLPIPSGVTADQINSVHYMMARIDAANAKRGTITTYASSPDATMNIMSADRVVADVTELVVEPMGEFKVQLSISDVNSWYKTFIFRLSAVGNFTVNWGDGSAVETLTRTDTTETMYSHTYTNAGGYVVTIRGRATAYSTDEHIAAISFDPGGMTDSVNAIFMTSVVGDLGKIFPVLNTSISGTPRFIKTFRRCSIHSIPANLFVSVKGAPVSNMFAQTFELTQHIGSVPSGLFSGIVGAPVAGLFSFTFASSGNLSTIPSDLFSGISGAPIPYMFESTFSNCSDLTSIPQDLFAGIQGPPAEGMFQQTFHNCTGLTGEIPSGLFAGISGAPARDMFNGTFSGCYNVEAIPSGLFGTFSGAPVEGMFQRTFEYCAHLTSIADGIWDLSGVTNMEKAGMFTYTFRGCSYSTAASPNIASGSTVKLWQHFTALSWTSAFADSPYMFDYASIPNNWK